MRLAPGRLGIALSDQRFEPRAPIAVIVGKALQGTVHEGRAAGEAAQQDIAVDFGDCRQLGNELFVTRHGQPGPAGRTGLAASAVTLQHGEQNVRLERLGNERRKAMLHLARHAVPDDVGRHRDDRQVDVAAIGTQAPRRFVAIHDRHLDIHQDHRIVSGPSAASRSMACRPFTATSTCAPQP
jgi:hypothetical protein